MLVHSPTLDNPRVFAIGFAGDWESSEFQRSTGAARKAKSIASGHASTHGPAVILHDDGTATVWFTCHAGGKVHQRLRSEDQAREFHRQHAKRQTNVE